MFKKKCFEIVFFLTLKNLAHMICYKGFWFEILVISLLFAISINIQRIFLLMKKRDEKNKIDKPNKSNIS